MRPCTGPYHVNIEEIGLFEALGPWGPDMAPTAYLSRKEVILADMAPDDPQAPDRPK